MARVTAYFLVMLAARSAFGVTCAGSLVILNPVSELGQQASIFAGKAGLQPVAVVADDGTTIEAGSSGFDVIVQIQGDLEQTARELQGMIPPVVGIFAASSHDLILADQVTQRLRAHGLSLPAPGDVSEALLDREKLHAALPEAYRPAQKVSDDLAVLVQWSRQQRRWPVVVKPARAFSDEVAVVCKGQAEVHAAFNAIQARGAQADFSRRVVVQEFLGEIGWTVTGVRAGDRLHLSGLWRRQRSAHSPLAPSVDTLELIPRPTPLLDRVEKVLAAVGFNQGPFRVEFSQAIDREFLVVGVHRGLSEDGFAMLENLATDSNPIERTFEAQSGQSLGGPDVAVRKKHAAIVSLATRQAGARASRAMEPVLRRLKEQARTVVDYGFFHPEFELLPRSESRHTLNARVWLLFDSEREMALQISELLDWEKQGLFED